MTNDVNMVDSVCIITLTSETGVLHRWFKWDLKEKNKLKD